MRTEALLNHYAIPAGTWDEMIDNDTIRQQYQNVVRSLTHLDSSELQQKDKLAGDLFMNQGITFTVYSDDAGIERIFPFDIIPRIITGDEWSHIERGIEQRLKALNCFLKDIYH